MNPFALTEPQLRRFHKDGYFLVDDLFDRDEIDLLRNIARSQHHRDQQAASRRDGQGGAIKLSVHNELGDDIYSAFVRSRRIVETMERLLDGEVYHYHHKMILKEPLTGGAWEWHQDYGYWYNNGCLFPQSGELHDRGGPGDERQRLSASPQRLPPHGTHRARQGG